MDHHFSYWFRSERLGGGTLIASWYEINNDSLLFFFCSKYDVKSFEVPPPRILIWNIF